MGASGAAHAQTRSSSARIVSGGSSQPAVLREAEPAAHRCADGDRQARRDHGCEGSTRQGPVLLITDPALRVNNPDNTTHTAGTTFFGQFVDHDTTFDLNSRLGVPTRPEDSPNSRTPALDLDSVYGGGPVRSPELYGRRNSREPLAGIKFIVENGGLFEDLPRTPSGTAILGDPRNDENVILAGLHAAFLLFHNNAVDYVAERNRRLERRCDLPRSAAAHDLALPVDDRARVPAADHRSTARERHPHARPQILSAARRVHARGVPGRVLSLRPQHGATVLSRQPGRRQRRRRSSPSSSIPRRKARPIRATCAAAYARRAGSSAGRRSSTSATATCATTNASIRPCRRRCSPCHAPRSPAKADRSYCRSAISCGTSRGRCRPVRRSHRRCGHRNSRPEICRICGASARTSIGRHRCSSTSCGKRT